MTPIEEGLDITLDHFQEPIWPRSISTKTTECRQVLVDNRDEALARFKLANYQDCRISAYSPNADENQSTVARFQGIMTATPSNIIVMIDLDKCNFKSERSLSLALSSSLKNIKEKLGVGTPTVLWSGRGYHIIQPLDANGIILEQIKQFENVQQPSVKFLRFAEWFLSKGKFLSDSKSDPIHNNTVSFGNMMLRMPGSFNSKNGQEVKLVHKWDGQRPLINYLLRDFRHWLIDQVRIQQQEHRHKRLDRSVNSYNQCGVIHWIENLLRTPITDYRKLATWRIFAPYLLNIRGLSNDEAHSVISEWLEHCGKLRRLDFTPSYKIKRALNGSRDFLPVSCDKLKVENEGFYNLLQDNGVLT
jgi:hypothetical protein